MTNVRRVLLNSTVLMAAEAATRVVSLVAILYLSRTLAPAAMGMVTFGLAVFAVFQLVAAGGVDVLLAREAAERPRDASRLAGRSLVLAWTWLALAYAAFLVGATLFDVSGAMRSVALWFGLAAAFVPLAMRFALVAEERAWVMGGAALLGQVAFLTLCLALVRRPDDWAGAGIAWTAAVAARSAVPFAAFLQRHRAVVVERRGLAAALVATAGIGTGSAARGLMTTVDVLVLGFLVAPAEVAAYGLATKLPLFLASLAGLAYTAVFPTLARAVVARDAARLAAVRAGTLEGVLAVALPGALALTLAAGPIMALLFTDHFRAAAPLLALLLWRVPLVAVGGLHRTLLWARDPARDARTATHVLGVTLAALALLGGAFGATGAAVAVLIGDAAAVVLYARRTAGPASAVPPRRMLGRLALASALAVAIVLALPRDTDALAVLGAITAWGAGSAVAALPSLRRLLRTVRAAVPPVEDETAAC